jgi:hypothetical protein
LLLLVSAGACTVESSPDDGTEAPSTNTGATASTGGAATGGIGETGGASTGGIAGTGATASTGGFVGTGATDSGGAATGGVTGSGATDSGGSTGTGGASTGGSGTGGASTGGASTGGSSTGGSSSSECPYQGNITYTLAKAAQPTEKEQKAYDLITAAMDEALSYYNCYTNIERTTPLNITYNPGVATADGNPNGSIRFGDANEMYYMNYITAMHEMSHVFGIGDNNWDSMIQNGIFPGPQATAELRAITGKADDQVHGDVQHFWPYGLNQKTEVSSEADLLNHCRMVVAIREDLGY